MEKDLDKKLYNDYLNGDKEAFEFIYGKYKNKIKYFIYTIVKDYEVAEDLTQETFIYVMQNRIQENTSFRYYIYLVAKSKAFNYVKKEKRRTEITELYLFNKNQQIEKDVLEIISKEETKKELLESINLLDERYKNAIYLVNIAGLSYEETANILDENLQNTKNLIYRGKMQLRKILLKKGFDEMNKSLKILLIFLFTGIILSGVVYAGTIIYNNYIKNNKNHNISINPSYQSTIDANTSNNLWIGTLDLAWKELESQLKVDKINLEENNLPIVDELNSSEFTKDMLNENDYSIKVERTNTNGYKIDASLNKKLHFLEMFDNFCDIYQLHFGNSQEFIKYFGINNASAENLYKNVEILFFNKDDEDSANSSDFAIKLKTQENDEIILYRTNENKNFNEYYKDIQSKTNSYTGTSEFCKGDELRIPCIRVNGMITYNELYGKTIKDTNMYFSDIIQNVNFNLNEKGCNLSSESTLVTEVIGISAKPKHCYFDNQFIIFMKEENSNSPYFALKVDNTDILEKSEEINEPKIIDYTVISPEKYQKNLISEKYKFFEDEKYEYYYQENKSAYVIVYFKNGEFETVESALKDRKNINRFIG